MAAPKGWEDAQAFQSKPGTNPQKKGVAIPAHHDSPELREHAIKYLRDAGCRDILVYENVTGYLIVAGERDIILANPDMHQMDFVDSPDDIGYFVVPTNVPYIQLKFTITKNGVEFAGLDIKEPDNVPCSNG